MSFGALLRVKRTVAGLSQMDLANKTGVPHSAISLIENGKVLPAEEWEGAIRAALNWPAEQDVSLTAALHHTNLGTTQTYVEAQAENA